jgi:hypothetical protein
MKTQVILEQLTTCLLGWELREDCKCGGMLGKPHNTITLHILILTLVFSWVIEEDNV